MSTHLTVRELSETIAAHGSRERHPHLVECERCRQEAQQLHDALVRFGDAVRTWSHDEEQVECRSRAGFALAFPRVVAMIASIVLITLLVVAYPRKRVHPSPAAGAQALSDIALLNQIQADISQPVPIRLLPLLVQSNRGFDPRDITK